MLEPQPRGGQMDQANAYGHNRSRTASSSGGGMFPPVQGQSMSAQARLSLHPNQPNQAIQQNQKPHYSSNSSRHSPPSNNYSASSNIAPPAAYRNSSSLDLRRSTSSRSFGQPQLSGYVALLRKQKATVWCDRAQFEDPRLAAQQRAAKMRAALEVSEGVAPFGSIGSAGGRTSTGISATGKVASKIRHHGKTPMVGYAGENHVGVGGVPMRLSATEVEAESSEDEDNFYPSRTHHSRTGSSGRSSIGSGRRNTIQRASGGPGTQVGGGRRFTPNDTPERAASWASTIDVPVPRTPTMDDAASGRTMSAGSGSSVERADNVGELGAPTRLASKSMMHSAVAREKSGKGSDELRRRGSVDDRTSTLTSGRLFIANPD